MSRGTGSRPQEVYFCTLFKGGALGAAGFLSLLEPRFTLCFPPPIPSPLSPTLSLPLARPLLLPGLHIGQHSSPCTQYCFSGQFLGGRVAESPARVPRTHSQQEGGQAMAPAHVALTALQWLTAGLCAGHAISSTPPEQPPLRCPASGGKLTFDGS